MVLLCRYLKWLCTPIVAQKERRDEQADDRSKIDYVCCMYIRRQCQCCQVMLQYLDWTGDPRVLAQTRDLIHHKAALDREQGSEGPFMYNTLYSPYYRSV